jgi:hypothetical protein
VPSTKAFLLLVGYMMRLSEMDDSVKAELDEILAKAPYYVELMI